MAGFSDLPALEINPVGFGAANNQALASSGLSQLALQKQQALQPLQIQQQQTEIPLEIKQKQIETQNAQNASQLQQVNTGNSLIANAVRATQAADGPDKNATWDREMQKVVDAGYPQAQQYIGHYREGLAQNLSASYGGDSGPQGARAAAAEEREQFVQDQGIQRAVAQMPLPALIKSQANLEKTLDAWDNIARGGKAAWDEEMANLKAAGIDPVKDGHMASTEYNALNYAAAARLIKTLMPYRNAVSDRVAILSAGLTPAAQQPIGKSTLVGTDPATGKPIYHNPETGQDTEGQFQLGPKPTAATSVFQFKYKMAVDHGMSDQDALQFANGRRTLPDTTLAHWAEQGANSELGEVTMAGGTVSDPQAWVAQRKQQLFQQYKASQGGPNGGAPPPGGGAANLPPKALSAVQAGKGQVVTFNNGQQWRLVNGRPVRVK